MLGPLTSEQFIAKFEVVDFAVAWISLLSEMKWGGNQLGVSAAWISIPDTASTIFFITMAISICDDVIIMSPGREWETPDVSQKSAQETISFPGPNYTVWYYLLSIISNWLIFTPF